MYIVELKMNDMKPVQTLLVKHLCAAMAAWLVLGGLSLFAQLPNARTAQSQDKKDNEMLSDAPSLSVPTATALPTVVTDSPVLPQYYVVGPGDVLTVQIVGVVSGEFPVAVSPENTILLPRLGELNVQGKTLAQVKTDVQKLMQARNPLNKVFVTLQKARLVYVRFTGNVATPGTYTLPASMRVSTAVNLINQTANAGTKTPQQLLRQNEQRERATKAQYTPPAAARLTRVLHRDGTSAVADVIRATFLNDPHADPTVREGDEIFVPFDHETQGLVAVMGAVNRPCVLPWRKGDNLSLLLKAAYGLTEYADSANVLLKGGVSAGAAESTTLSAALVLSGQYDREIPAGTSVVVKEQERRKTVTVTVLGEVKFPGVYTLDAADANAGTAHRLKEAVRLAGGLTSAAHLPTSYITRRDVLSSMVGSAAVSGGLMETEMFRNAQFSTLSAEDTTRYALDMNVRRPTVACDMSAALERNSEADNVPLQDGDVVMIAANPNNVYVFGQVNRPGYVEFQAGRSLEHYLNRAGGFATGAEAKRVRVIKAGSRVWVEAPLTTPAPATLANATPNSQVGVQTISLEAGDQIYVPRLADSISDISFKRQQLAVQKEGNELQRKNIEIQEGNRVWQIIGTIFGALTTTLSFLITFGVVRINPN
jgi:protein involved in polysaccharide export with SLBB domain